MAKEFKKWIDEFVENGANLQMLPHGLKTAEAVKVLI